MKITKVSAHAVGVVIPRLTVQPLDETGSLFELKLTKG
jgi:hypothetical protein